MADLTLQSIGTAGNTPTFTAAAAGGDRVPAIQGVVFHVKNGSGASINVTLDSYTLCSYGFDHDLVVAVPAGQERQISGLNLQRFNNAGWIGVSYSAVTTVTVAAYVGA